MHFIQLKEEKHQELNTLSNQMSVNSQLDALIICCALTHQTHHTINKKGVIIIVGRGGIIDEKEMAECLAKGEIGGAGLDVFENNISTKVKGCTPDEQSQNQNVPQVLLLKSPPAFALFGDEFFSSNKFRLLKAYESSLPLDQFLETNAESIEAILSSGGASVTADILQQLPLVRLVVTTHAGLDHIDLAECRRRNIAVTNAGNIFSEDVADHAIGLMIDLLRKVSAADRYVRRGLWAANGDYPIGFKLERKRIGIVGLGKIGFEIAKRLESFGCCISYNSRQKKASVSFPFYSNVCELATNSDVLIICCALSEQTHHMINKEALTALGKEGFIVNIARGSIINEQELVQCLVQGEISGAGLDVFENEPDIPGELFALDNVVLSPHIAIFTLETFRDLRELVVGNLEAFFSNKQLLSEVVYD